MCVCVCLWILVSVGQIRRVKRKRVDLAEATPHGCWPTNGLDVNGAPVRPLLPIHRGGGPRFQQFSNHLQKWTNSHKTLKTLNEDSTTKRLCLSRFVQLFFIQQKCLWLSKKHSDNSTMRRKRYYSQLIILLDNRYVNNAYASLSLLKSMTCP